MSRLEISTVGYATYPMRTGEYIAPFPEWRTTTRAIVANTLYAVPFLVPYNTTWDRIALEVTTLVLTTNIRLGIYRDGTNLYPGTLLLDAGTVSSATTGVKAITISQALTPALYWLALVSDGAPTIRALESPAYGGLGLTASAFNDWQGGWSVAFTYAALPDPFTAAGSLTVAPHFQILLRLLSVP